MKLRTPQTHRSPRPFRRLSPLVIAGVAGLATSALAQPQGGQVVSGSATFNQNGATTVIHASNNTIINYHSFNIPAGTGVQFVQPGATSRVLNRVTGSDPSRIAGSLTANGIVYIVNPAGVFFAQGSLVDVGGLAAAGGRLSNSDFLAGRDRFTGLTGRVENRGMITGDAVTLMGSRVANYGTIVAPQGMVAMAAGDEVLVGRQNGNFYAKVSGAGGGGGGTGVTQAGTIAAPGGQVLLGAGDMYAVAIDHGGSTTARDIRLEGGKEGVVSVSGSLNATNPSGTGGTVKVLGDKVGLFGASVNASGAAGGGSILIGGGRQGRGPEPTAAATYVSADSVVRADATHHGDGGEIIVWSELVSRIHGKFSARGGAQGGNGGFVETSGKRELRLSGTPDVTAALGRGGMWLIDPEDLTIVATPTANVSTTPPPPATVFESTGAGAELFVGDLLAALTGGASVEVRTGSTGSATGGVLTLQSGVNMDFDGTGSNTLSLIAHRRVVIDGQIFDSVPGGGDSLNLILIGDVDGNGSGNVVINNTVSTGGGTFTASGVDFILASTGLVTTGGGDVEIATTGAIRLGAGLDAGTGGLTFDGAVILTADLTLIGNTIAFGSTLDSDGTARDLTLNAPGETLFSGIVGGASPLGTLTTDAPGTVEINTSAMTADELVFNDGVTVFADTTLTGQTSVTFAGTVDSSPGEQDLTVNSPLTTFGGLVGSAGVLGLLRTDADGTTTLDGASVAAATIQFDDDVILGTDVAASGTTSVQFGGAVDSESGEGNDLVISSPQAILSGIVGGAAGGELGLLQTGVVSNESPAITADRVVFGNMALGTDSVITAATSADFLMITSQAGQFNDLTINSPLTRLGGVIGTGAGPLGTLRTDAAGVTRLEMGSPAGGPSVNAQVVDFQDAVELWLNSRITGTTSVTFAGTLDSMAGPARDLILTSPIKLFGGVVGGTNPLRSLITLAGGETTIDTATMTADSFDFRDNVVLGVDATLNGTTQVRFGGGLGSESGEANDLTINSPDTIFAGIVGQAAGGALGTLRTDADGTTTLQGAVSGASVIFGDAVIVAADSTVTGTTAVTFESTVDGTADELNNLIVNSPATRFEGVIGGTSAIGTLRTDAAGTTTIATADVTADTIELLDAVVLEQSTTFTGATAVRIRGTLNSEAGLATDLTIDSPITELSGGVGGGTDGELGDVRVVSAGTTTISGGFQAASLEVTNSENAASLSGIVSTSGVQTYTASVLVAGDTTIDASGVTFFGTVNSQGNPHALTINTTGNGVTRFNGPVGNLGSGGLSSLTTNADGQTILAGGTVRTSGTQHYQNAVVLGNTTTLTGTSLTFDSTINSDGSLRSLTINTTGTGTTTFSGAIGNIVRLNRLETNSDGSTILDGGTVVTEGAQVYNDSLVLGANTTLTAGGVTFGGTVNSDEDAARSLTVNTPGSTTFVGVVGGTRALSSITTDAPGRTRFLTSSIRTTGTQTYNDAVLVNATTAIDAPTITFNSTVDAENATGPSNLTLNTSTLGVTTFAGVVGGQTPLQSLTTNADGRTRIGADITTAGSQTYGDAVMLFADVTLADRGATGIRFNSTIDSEGDARALTIAPDPDSNATVSTPTLSRVVFTGPIGGITPLASLTLGGPRSTIPTVADFVAGVNPSGSAAPNYSLVINTGEFTMAEFHKFTVLGDLTINAGGAATVGDINTLGNLVINADSIAIRTRPGGQLLVPQGSSFALGRDRGVDFVAGGQVSFSQTPSLLGSFAPPAFGTPDAGGVSGTLSQFAQRAVGSVTAASMLVSGTALDLHAAGASSVNLAEALPGPVDQVALADSMPPVRGLTSAQAALLADAGIDPRLVEARHMPIAGVSEFVAAYESLFYRDTVDAGGGVVREPQADRIRQVLENGWTEYAAAARGQADPMGFRAYVEAVPEQTEARYYLDSLRDLFVRLGQLGLTPGEAAQVRQNLLARVAFPGLPVEQLETAVMATQLGAAPANEPALAAR